jgi:hypothetical protein
MYANQSTIRKSIQRSENMIVALEMQTVAGFDHEAQQDMNITKKYMLGLERRVLATLRELYTKRGGKL